MKFDSFNNIFRDSTSLFTKIKKEDYQDAGRYPIIDQGQSFIGGYTDDESVIVKENLPVIIFGDHTKIFKYVDFPFTIGADGVKVLTLKNNQDSPLFYYYFLKSITLVDKGYSRHFKYLKEKKLPVVYPNIQLHIANILSKADNLIAQRKESIHLLDAFLRSSFLEMFGHPSTNIKRMEKVSLNKFGQIITGNTPSRKVAENYSSNHIEWIKTDNIQSDSTFVTEALEYLSEAGLKSARTVNKGALLVACIAGSIDSVGRAALTNRTVAFNQQINAIQPNSDVESLYMYWLFKISRKYIQGHASKGMKKMLSKGEFEKIKMIKPPFELQTQFSQLAEKVEVLKTQFQQSLLELENLYGSLSQKAFSGNLDIKI